MTHHNHTHHNHKPRTTDNGTNKSNRVRGNWQISPWDIAWCRFPMSHDPNMPGDIIRPAVILGVFRYRQTDTLHCLASYGTSRFKACKTVSEVRITYEDDILAAGLTQRTRFVLNNSRIIPVNGKWFSFKSQTCGPVSGRMSDTLAGKARKIMWQTLCRTLEIRNLFNEIEVSKDVDPEIIHQAELALSSIRKTRAPADLQARKFKELAFNPDPREPLGMLQGVRDPAKLN